MIEIVLVFHLFIAISMVISVLLQRSEGGALGMGGGGGGSAVGGGVVVNVFAGFIGSTTQVAAEIDKVLTKRQRASGLGFVSASGGSG